MMENESVFATIAAVHKDLTQRNHSPSELFEFISENEDILTGAENDYHNICVEFSRQDCDSYAADIARIGSRCYPMSTTLLADLIKYSQESGEIEACQEGVEKLSGIDRKYWEWRTFVFVIDYLKDSFASVTDEKTYEKNLAQAKGLIEDFKRYIPHEERSYVAEAELLINMKEYDEAIKALLAGINSVGVAPQCCLKLADMYLERGMYQDAAEMALKAILAAAQVQPTISVAYAYYVWALSLDAMRLQEKQEGKEISLSEARGILTAYETADKLFVMENRSSVAYRKTIKARCCMIKMEEGMPVEEEPDSTKMDLAKLLSELQKGD